MNWLQIRPVILSVFRSISDVPQILWADQPQQYIDPAARSVIRLSIKSVVSQGWDELRPEYDASYPRGQEIGDLVNGIRNFTLSIRAESFEQTDGRTASTYLEQIRDRLNRRSCVDALEAVNVAMYDEASSTDLSGPVDGRIQSVAVMDLYMRTMVQEMDPNRYGYIDSVGLVDRFGRPIRISNLGSDGASLPIGA